MEQDLPAAGIGQAPGPGGRDQARCIRRGLGTGRVGARARTREKRQERQEPEHADGAPGIAAGDPGAAPGSPCHQPCV